MAGRQVFPQRDRPSSGPALPRPPALIVIEIVIMFIMFSSSSGSSSSSSSSRSRSHSNSNDNDNNNQYVYRALMCIVPFATAVCFML